jgi:DNA transformation protein
VAVSKAYADQVCELLSFVPGLRVRRMFGGMGVFCDDMMFGLIAGDELYLKADGENRSQFEAEGCAPFTYPRGDTMMDLGYRRAPDAIWDDPDEARRWADLAVGAAVRKRSSSPTRKQKKL